MHAGPTPLHAGPSPFIDGQPPYTPAAWFQILLSDTCMLDAWQGPPAAGTPLTGLLNYSCAAVPSAPCVTAAR